MGWTVRDTAAHLAGGCQAYIAILRGAGSPVERLDDVVAWNSQTVRSSDERDLSVYADQIDRALDEALATVPSGKVAPLVAWHGGLQLPLATVWAALAGEALVHGYDIATATGTRWLMSREDVVTVLLGLLPLIPHYVNREEAADVRACFYLRLRSRERPDVLWCSSEEACGLSSLAPAARTVGSRRARSPSYCLRMAGLGHCGRPCRGESPRGAASPGWPSSYRDC